MQTYFELTLGMKLTYKDKLPKHIETSFLNRPNTKKWKTLEKKEIYTPEKQYQPEDVHTSVQTIHDMVENSTVIK